MPAPKSSRPDHCCILCGTQYVVRSLAEDCQEYRCIYADQGDFDDTDDA